MSMARNAQDVYRDVLALSDEEREELLRLLTRQRDEGWASPEIERAWMEELARREKLEAEGKMGYVSIDEAMAQVRKIIDG
jgi:hypothetical protein